MPSIVNKQIGSTPLETINKYTKESKSNIIGRIAYAGRLDPMAEGLLLLLIGPETKQRHKYQNLDKKYEFEVLFGISTDTYDLMGIPTMTRTHLVIDKDIIKEIIPNIIKLSKQSYPPYSSKTVNGKPLYWYARSGKLKTIKIPTRQINIYELEFIGLKRITTKVLHRRVRLIEKVEGDFRQKKILSIWEKLIKTNPQKTYQVAKFRIHCSSGTYVRGIANDMGKMLGTRSLSFSIKRTQIGKYRLEDAIKL